MLQTVLHLQHTLKLFYFNITRDNNNTCPTTLPHTIIMNWPSMASIYATNCGHIYCIHFSMEDNRHRDSVEFGCRWWPIEIIYFYEKFTRKYCEVQLTRPELNWTDDDGRYFLPYVHFVINRIYVVSPI